MLHKKFFIKKDQTVLVGDTEVDSTLAKNFKIKFILIKKGYTTLKPFDISSDVMISDFSQITQFLKKIS
jgi:phosphoglycolate phosphatase-like HAD superfamily hydrolase